MLLSGGGGGGYSSGGGGSQGYGPYLPKPKPKKKPAPSRPPSRSSSSSGSSYSRGRSSSYGGGGSSRYGGGGGGGGGGRPAPPPKPRYAGPPPPSAQMIAQLYGQLGEIGRQKKTYEADYNRGRSGAYSARGLFLKQLEDQYKTQGTQTAADFAARGLSQSGLLTEAMATLGKQKAGEQAGYQTQFQGQLDQLLSQLTSQRGELSRRRRTLSDRYHQARGDRARILKLMGA